MSDWIDACRVSDCPQGSVVEVIVEGNIVAIANVSGEFHAMDGICAHQGGPLGKGRLEGCRLTCPWHGWQYDVTSGQQLTAASIVQRTFRVREVGGTIQVELGAAGDE